MHPSTADIYTPQSECCWCGFIGLFRSLKPCNVKPLDESSLLFGVESMFLLPVSKSLSLSTRFFLLWSRGNMPYNSAECWMCYLDRNVQVFISCQTILPITGDSPVEFHSAHILGSCMLPRVFSQTDRGVFGGEREAFMEEFGKIGNV